jgi:hypothetical protein
VDLSEIVVRALIFNNYVENYVICNVELVVSVLFSYTTFALLMSVPFIASP